MNAKRRGTAREHAASACWRPWAIPCSVWRSHGLFDLIAISSTDKVCVQVKSRDLPGPLEREALEAFKAPGNCRKVVHVWKDREASPRVVELP